jgi:translocation and assembly module TamA
VEYEQPLKDAWSGAAFVDAGNAFDNTAHLTMNVGAGFGVRYKSPLGPIRADIASPKDDVGDVHFYFSLGPDL